MGEVEPRDRWAHRFVGAIPALAEAVGGEEGLSRLLETRSDQSVLWRRRRIHVECFGADAAAPTVLFHHGYGAYSALYAPFLALLSLAGINVIAIDRPGHGLSDGRRGDCTVAELAEVTGLVLKASVRASGPVMVFGSSAGGMLTSCLIPYLGEEIDGYVCHGLHNPRHARPGLGRLLAAGAEAAPWARLPYEFIPRHIRAGISEHPVVQEWFRPGSDPLAIFTQTLRSVFSMTVAYRPPPPASTVRRPVLVLAGDDDKMLPARDTSERARRLALPDLELRVLEGGHMLLHEHPREVVAAVTGWIDRLT